LLKYDHRNVIHSDIKQFKKINIYAYHILLPRLTAN